MNLIKENEHFICKEKSHIAYDVLIKKEIATIFKGIKEDKNSQTKNLLILKSRKKSLFFFSLFMLENLVYEDTFIIQHTLSNKVKTITSVNICATRSAFIDKKLAKKNFEKFDI